jgi:hypothetical protein
LGIAGRTDLIVTGRTFVESQYWEGKE